MAVAKNILISAGGTGGHFFPALALAKSLRANGKNVILTTDKRCKSYIPDDALDMIVVQNVKRFRKRPIALMLFSFTLLYYVWSNLALMRNKHIDVVLTFGGYQGIAVLLAAYILRIPIILNEQNIIAGRTNRFFAKMADKITVGFNSQQGFEAFKDKVVLTGIPVRQEFYSEAKIPDKKFLNILVTGGSQGASIFSRLTPDLLAKIKPGYLSRIKLVQQVRAEDREPLDLALSSYKINKRLEPFFTNMADEMINSDLVIARSGASTIAELIAIKKPSIFIPYPHAMDNHQYHNAKELEGIGVSFILDQDKLDTDKLASFIEQAIEDRAVLDEMSAKYQDHLQYTPIESITNLINEYNVNITP
ncbi:MAG: undecaprenyldiphospho-muramoylpentapeptide beta-N-acetylglucosaminyltransferase [Rickettsiales bacterium]|jgi:UDP-N-acetylglucosamine--N-acetylmuramyl-(pentapeptide) pyrophosphoryl-undecaprenol N-acetylglucosamine transferase|nr:undecaprenyldiphospho-muramoylpentapeptide beta-N-acetylglucosaminyltransferase [Rickettsiales bacterium]